MAANQRRTRREGISVMHFRNAEKFFKVKEMLDPVISVSKWNE